MDDAASSERMQSMRPPRNVLNTPNFMATSQAFKNSFKSSQYVKFGQGFGAPSEGAQEPSIMQSERNLGQKLETMEMKEEGNDSIHGVRQGSAYFREEQ